MNKVGAAVEFLKKGFHAVFNFSYPSGSQIIDIESYKFPSIYISIQLYFHSCVHSFLSPLRKIYFVCLHSGQPNLSICIAKYILVGKCIQIQFQCLFFILFHLKVSLSRVETACLKMILQIQYGFHTKIRKRSLDNAQFCLQSSILLSFEKI